MKVTLVLFIKSDTWSDWFISTVDMPVILPIYSYIRITGASEMQLTGGSIKILAYTWNQEDDKIECELEDDGSNTTLSLDEFAVIAAKHGWVNS